MYIEYTKVHDLTCAAIKIGVWIMSTAKLQELRLCWDSDVRS